MPIKLQIRRGTASNWSTTSPAPVLLDGEIGYETDTGNFKVGDGTTAWASLPYALPHKTGTVAAAVASIISIDQANARVGIGTTTPLSQLHVESAAPIVRLRDSGANPGVYSAIDGNNTEGSLTITADVGNAVANSSVSIATDSTIRTTFTQDGSNNTRVGIGTISPATALHLSTDAPIIRLTDTGAATVYSEVNQDNGSGTLVLSADEPNQGAGTSLNLRTDGTTRVILDNTGMTVYPPINPAGGFISGTIATNALANGAVTAAKTTFGVERKREVLVVGTTSWTVPSNVYAIRAWLVGGGGGGGRTSQTPPNLGSDGGHGGFGCFDAQVVPGTVISGIQVGAGGAGTAAAPASGSAGTSTIFAGFTASGGGGGGSTAGNQGANGTFTQGSAPTGVTHIRNNRQWDNSVFVVWASSAVTAWVSGATTAPALVWAETTSLRNPGARGQAGGQSDPGTGGMSGAIFIEYLVVA